MRVVAGTYYYTPNITPDWIHACVLVCARIGFGLQVPKTVSNLQRIPTTSTHTPQMHHIAAKKETRAPASKPTTCRAEFAPNFLPLRLHRPQRARSCPKVLLYNHRAALARVRNFCDALACVRERPRARARPAAPFRDEI